MLPQRWEKHQPDRSLETLEGVCFNFPVCVAPVGAGAGGYEEPEAAQQGQGKGGWMDGWMDWMDGWLGPAVLKGALKRDVAVSVVATGCLSNAETRLWLVFVWIIFRRERQGSLGPCKAAISHRLSVLPSTQQTLTYC